MYRDVRSAPFPGTARSTGGVDTPAVGKRTLTEGLPIQRRADPAAPGRTTAQPTAAAAHATSGAAGPLPHVDRIQAAFGRHDVRAIRAYIGGAAAEGATALNAHAFATGNEIAFAKPPDLHTAAHEAAHVVQQRGGLQLAGGMGEAGDSHERHADEVADAVVAGKSAEALLDRYGGSGGAPARGAAVQAKFRSGPPEWEDAVVKMILSSPNAHMYQQIARDDNFMVRINLSGGISNDPKVLAETSGSVEVMGDQYDMRTVDLRRKPPTSSLETYITDVGGATSGEMKVDVFDRYFRVDDQQKRTDHDLSKWDKMAALIHELDLHVIPGYQRWLLARGAKNLSNGAQPDPIFFKQTGVHPNEGAEGAKRWIKAEFERMLNQDEHLNRTNLLNMLETCYRYATSLPPLEGQVVLRSMQEDLYTIPGLPKPEAVKLEEIAKQRAS